MGDSELCVPQVFMTLRIRDEKNDEYQLVVSVCVDPCSVVWDASPLGGDGVDD